MPGSVSRSAVCAQGFAFIDRSRQTSDDERRERQGLPGFRFVVPQVSARPGHIDFEQAMDHGLAFDRRIHDLQDAPEFRIRDHLVLILPCVHRDTFPLSVGLLLRFRQYMPLLRTRNLQVPTARYKSNIFNILILFLLPLHASLGVLRGGLSGQEIAHAYFGEQVARMSGISLQFVA